MKDKQKKLFLVLNQPRKVSSKVASYDLTKSIQPDDLNAIWAREVDRYRSSIHS